ncbi:unnamed protein product [Gadus morhua 'NCC']
MPESDLDDLVTELVSGNDLVGPEYVRAALRARGLRVQRRTVRESMLRTNPGAAAVRSSLQRPERRTYQVQGPNSSWHIDGIHKLIRWRMVIHGGIDGYSRLVVFLRDSSNNRSSTVLESFVNAVDRYGVPSRGVSSSREEVHLPCSTFLEELLLALPLLMLLALPLLMLLTLHPLMLLALPLLMLLALHPLMLLALHPLILLVLPLQLLQLLLQLMKKLHG